MAPMVGSIVFFYSKSFFKRFQSAFAEQSSLIAIAVFAQEIRSLNAKAPSP